MCDLDFNIKLNACISFVLFEQGFKYTSTKCSYIRMFWVAIPLFQHTLLIMSHLIQWCNNQHNSLVLCKNSPLDRHYESLVEERKRYIMWFCPNFHVKNYTIITFISLPKCLSLLSLSLSLPLSPSLSLSSSLYTTRKQYTCINI